MVQVRHILPDRADWLACRPITSAAFDCARPAATLVIAGLQEPKMRIEIEVTARVGGG